jgi:hypothetical protein
MSSCKTPRPESPIQFQRRLYRTVINGNAAQAGTRLITRILDRLQVVEGAFFGHCDRPDVQWWRTRPRLAVSSNAARAPPQKKTPLEGAGFR